MSTTKIGKLLNKFESAKNPSSAVIVEAKDGLIDQLKKIISLKKLEFITEGGDIMIAEPSGKSLTKDQINDLTSFSNRNKQKVKFF